MEPGCGWNDVEPGHSAAEPNGGVARAPDRNTCYVCFSLYAHTKGRVRVGDIVKQNQAADPFPDRKGVGDETEKAIHANITRFGHDRHGGLSREEKHRQGNVETPARSTIYSQITTVRTRPKTLGF
ncbi:MAG: hypothetical protein JO061_14785 [Acidobacteriaceae bacterium]|nr:hypothetical protein [Acidobacteriaceae bacterium]